MMEHRETEVTVVWYISGATVVELLSERPDDYYPYMAER